METASSRQSANPQLDEVQTAKVIDVGIAQSDALRSNALSVAADLVSSRVASLTEEAGIVTTEYGAESPEMIDILGRLYVQSFAAAVAGLEGQRALIAPPAKLDAATGAIIGQVVDPSNKILANYTVSALDDADVLLAYACSDANGTFAIRIPVAAGTTTSVRLRVTDAQEQTRFQDATAAAISPQVLCTRELQVGDPVDTCVAPKDAVIPASAAKKSTNNPPPS
ncbi:MAG TPA: carboxypeptidase-like regulatory domain-containing protein [Candidatus Binatia bacterium]|nr:carboxypeptidase-like regulatory domain-containing protein [Candidatus Binatia bacterium]